MSLTIDPENARQVILAAEEIVREEYRAHLIRAEAQAKTERMKRRADSDA